MCQLVLAMVEIHAKELLCRTLTQIFSVCSIHNMKSRELIQRLEADGWVLRGTKGSHHIFIHPMKPGHISVPHPKNDLGIGLVSKLLKAAGLKEKVSS